MEWEDNKNKKMLRVVQIVVVLGAILGLAIYFIVSFKGKSKDTVNDFKEDDAVIEQVDQDPQALIEEAVEDDVAEVQVQEEDVQKWLTSMSEYEQEALRVGIDVAKWQGIIDWKQVASSGVEFVMIRVGYRELETGTICEDTTAKYNLQEATAAGLDVGAYFFSTAINEEEAKEEAKWVCDYIEQYPITYPVAYNCEGFNNEKNRQYGLTNEERTKIAIAFLDYVAQQDYVPMFYAARNELIDSRDWGTADLESRYKIWVARYVSSDLFGTKLDYSGNYDMWQYSQVGNISGITGNVDLNISYFAYSQKAGVKNDSTPDDVSIGLADLMNFKDVNEAVTAKDKTNLRSEPSTNDDKTIITQLKNGEQATRTGMDEKTGWSRLEYNGQVLYAVSGYLTTDLSVKPANTDANAGNTSNAGNTGTKAATSNANKVTTKDDRVVTFVDVDDTVMPKFEVNLRSEPSTSQGNDTIWYKVAYGEKMHRTGVAEAEGWSRIEYEGKSFYAVTSYLLILSDEQTE